MCVCVCGFFYVKGTFGREPQAKPEDDRYLRAAIQEYDNIAKLGHIMRDGPIKVRDAHIINALTISWTSSAPTHAEGAEVWRETIGDRFMLVIVVWAFLF